MQNLGPFTYLMSAGVQRTMEQPTKTYTETKKFSNSKPCCYLIYDKNSITKNGLKTDCSGWSTY